MHTAPDQTHQREEGSLHRWMGRCQAILFLVAISTPASITLLDDGHSLAVREEVRNEKRTPRKLPTRPTSLKDLAASPPDLDKWWNDNFGLRVSLVRLHNAIKLQGFGVAPSDRVLVGEGAEEPWLFANLSDPVDDFRGFLPFEKDQLNRWQRYIEQRRDWLARSNCRYVFVIAPNKSSIYPEFMPKRLAHAPGRTRLDQLVAHLEEHCDVPFIDFREVLHKAKRSHYAGVASDMPLYYPLGTHWNDYGAWVAHTELMSLIGDWFPNTWPTPPNRYLRREVLGEGDSWATRFHLVDLMPQYFAEWRYKGPPKVSLLPAAKAMLTYATPNSKRPEVVLLRDSFADALAPHIAPSFFKLHLIWNQTLGLEFSIRTILRIQPDLVIEEIVERRLMLDAPGLMPTEPAFRKR